ncbi:DUF7344 domain-containing protein [Natronolimnobius baerhuensis]|uniref:DUF7344 domain-containing protein n=1 Tax=Natronolimnobius baerhuensis TaxID=253108 RepID=A0A202E6G2_9EURY|nr:helix-turn-helix transcriptional regulator [Natronolimnobius baerhuensis]OVE83835.1 hypothetical protein B2G88_15570 [Natronolimnobius baerhuensis]
METDDIFTLLSNADRRCVLETLYERGPMTVDELATELASTPSGASADVDQHVAVSRAKISLIHQHLPQLADYSVIDYAGPDGSVSLEKIDELEDYLDAGVAQSPLAAMQ